MTGQHRGYSVPWRSAIACWWHGHRPERLPNGYWLCTRCERIAPTPVELP